MSRGGRKERLARHLVACARRWPRDEAAERARWDALSPEDRDHWRFLAARAIAWIAENDPEHPRGVVAALAAGPVCWAPGCLAVPKWRSKARQDLHACDAHRARLVDEIRSSEEDGEDDPRSDRERPPPPPPTPPRCMTCGRATRARDGFADGPVCRC